MGGKFWVSEKGRVLGPFTIDKLMELVDENWLSKMHLISNDQTTWINADDYENGALWDRTTAPANNDLHLVQPEVDLAVRNSSPPTEESMWWYTKNGQQLGPIPRSQLKRLFDCGDLKPDDQIWTEGMKSWKNAFIISDRPEDHRNLD